MEKLTKQFEEIIYEFRIGRNMTPPIERLITAVKAYTEYVIGQTIDGDKEGYFRSTDYILGHHDRGEQARQRAKETL